MKALAAFLLAFLLLLPAANAATGFELDHLTLYQPDEILRTRLTGAESLAEYVKQLQNVCTDFFATSAEPESLDIVVAVKPGKIARVWFISSVRTDDKALAPLRQKLEAVPACEVFGGPVAVAMSAKIAGGDGKGSPKNAEPPLPREWTVAMKAIKVTTIQVPDGFLAVVWPDAPGDAAPVPAPAGFVNQVLEPTGGRIFRPKDWFYVEAHHGPVYMWTISREDSEDHHPYTTGVRIQLFTGIKKGAGKTPKEFILDFVATKKKEATKVLNSCEPKEQGLFTRMCLETEEGPYHILYSLFWGADNMDLAVVTISGTNKELWDTYSPTFDRMSDFVLIDMKRFEAVVEINPPMTRIESRLISPQVVPDSFAAKPKIAYRAGKLYLRLEELPDPEHKMQQLFLVHEPDIWICNLLGHDGKHVLDQGPTYVVTARVLEKGPTVFSTLEYGNEARFFADHHATALPAQTLDGQPCEVSEIKGGAYRAVLFLRSDTHQPFQLDVIKDDKPDFSVRYLSYQTDLPFDAVLFTPPKDVTLTEEKPPAEK